MSPRDVSAIYSKGGAYRIMAKKHIKNLDYDKAIELQDMSILQSNKAIEIQPDYVYAYNGKSDALVVKGDICIAKDNAKEALELYKEAIETIEEVIKRTPKAKSAIERKQAIEGKITSLL